MSKPRFSLFYLAFVWLGLPVGANPLVDIPSGDFSCSVDLTPKNSGRAVAAGGGSIKQIEITQKGNLRQDVITRSDGSKTETWKVLDSGFSMIEALYPGKCIYDAPAGSFAESGMTRLIISFDPASLDWISNRSFVGKDDHGGKPSLHYRAMVTPPLTSPFGKLVQVSYEAWIDEKTLLPVAFDDSVYTYDLVFNPPPTEPLVLPDRFRQDFGEYQASHALLKRQ